MECVSSHWLSLACIKSRSGKFNQIHSAHPPRRTAVHHARIVFFSPELVRCDLISVESGKKGARQQNHEGKKKYTAAGGEMQTGSCWRRSMRKNGDAAGPGEGLLPRGNY